MVAEVEQHESGGIRWKVVRPNNPDSPDRIAFVDPDDLANLLERAERAEAAVARVRRLCGMTIEGSIRLQAIDQARDTLAVLDDRVSEHLATLDDTEGEA